MRLSEAIRIGASLNPQGIVMIKRNDKTCALGAAYEGTFGELEMPIADFTTFINGRSILSILIRKYPYLFQSVKFLDTTVALYIAIYMLNDLEKWTREQIADWVEKLENENGWTGVETPKENINALHQV